MQGYRHKTFYTQQTQPIHSRPGVHVVASLLKRWLLAVDQGSVAAQHLDAYLEEFAFRFNRRHSRKRGMLFYRLLENTVATIYAYADSSLARYPLTRKVALENKGSYPTFWISSKMTGGCRLSIKVRGSKKRGSKERRSPRTRS